MTIQLNLSGFYEALNWSIQHPTPLLVAWYILALFLTRRLLEFSAEDYKRDPVGIHAMAFLVWLLSPVTLPVYLVSKIITRVK